MKIYIKNMVCSRCKMVVKSELDKLGLHTLSVELGEIELEEDISDNQKTALVKRLKILGFEWLDDKKSRTVEKIKNLIVDVVQNKNNAISTNLSDYLVQHLAQDYNTLSNLFSEVENTTIEKYFITQKIEKMTHTYQLTGMTCGGCEAKVKSNLLALPDVTTVAVSKETNTATVSMEKHIALSDLQKALGGAESKYQISALQHNETVEQVQSWFETYKPILLIFGYITVVTLLNQWSNGSFDFMQWMRHFMAGFFLVFSFFKLLNLKGFAESYAMYDVIAMRLPSWGYVYALIELALGIAFLSNFQPVLTNAVTLIVMSVSIIGVLQSILNKKKIQCACLGAVFNLPMSTVTIIEDGLMIAMSVAMLFMMR